MHRDRNSNDEIDRKNQNDGHSGRSIGNDEVNGSRSGSSSYSGRSPQSERGSNGERDDQRMGYGNSSGMSPDRNEDKIDIESGFDHSPKRDGDR